MQRVEQVQHGSVSYHNARLMCTIVMCYHSITAVLPLYGYARQDKKDKSRGAITGKVSLLLYTYITIPTDDAHIML